MGHGSGDRRRWPARVGGVLLALVALGPPAAAAAPVAPLIAGARLEGRFLLAGRITNVSNVRGEHRGLTVSRTWTFTPTCPTGPCPTLKLARSRQTGTDRLVLTRTTPGSYQGSGSFYAPLRCGGKTYNRGERVPFTVTVHVSAASPTNLGIIATRVTATYANRQRINQTPCVTAPAGDSADYHGHLLPPNTTGGAPLSARSPGGS